MSDDEAAFLQTISAAPDDDLPRLVFADWLEERGDAERAEFIRLQCELASAPDSDPMRPFLVWRAVRLYAPYWALVALILAGSWLASINRERDKVQKKEGEAGLKKIEEELDTVAKFLAQQALDPKARNEKLEKEGLALFDDRCSRCHHLGDIGGGDTHTTIWIPAW